MAPEQWPISPYKRLASYTEADAPLFAGRDNDILNCAATLAEWKTRLLLLHGSTGCGKSSFLRAGLIPHLEKASVGIRFARTEQKGQVSTLLIRSTAEPLAKLADGLNSFASRSVTLQTPDGPHLLDLREALPEHGEIDATTFRGRYGEDPDALLKMLENLSRLVPDTLVLMIDQGEEVITVDQTTEGESRRKLFFQFLADFTQAEFDLKLLVVLRTEYFGRFISRGWRSFRASTIAAYCLNELSDLQVGEAILRPTIETKVRDLRPPREVYQFTFEPGVVDQIISELGRAGGTLPAVQIACATLYEKARTRPPPWSITEQDLRLLGGVEGSVERFLNQQIMKCATDEGLSLGEADREVVLWKEALHQLARPQPDGTVTSDLKPAATLRKNLLLSGLEFEHATDALASDEIGLLRQVNVVDANTGTLIPCFGLGHDVLGLVLHNWKLRHDRDRSVSGTFHFGEDDGRVAYTTTRNQIALCLCGGGYRAMLFNLGALWRINEIGYLPHLALVSGVSGGAIVAGLLGARWRDLAFDGNGVSTTFKKLLVEPLRSLAVRTIDIPGALWMLLGRSNPSPLIKQFQTCLYDNIALQDLPDEPNIVVTSTNLQTCSLFYFSKSYVGNYRLGRLRSPSLSLATAVAASAAMPPALSPLVLNFSDGDWEEVGSLGRSDPRYLGTVYLTDGALYDQFGVQFAWKRYPWILISDGAGLRREKPQPDANFMAWTAQLVRLAEATNDELRDVRRDQVLDLFRTAQRQGAYWSLQMPTLQVPIERTAELAEIPARFAGLTEDIQERLINLGYAACSAAIENQVSNASLESTFPYPNGV
jgi:NTE family protein